MDEQAQTPACLTERLPVAAQRADGRRPAQRWRADGPATGACDADAESGAGHTTTGAPSAEVAAAAARRLDLASLRTCDCPPSHLNCLSAREWIKYQVGVWQFAYERGDIRDRRLHPATFPLALARRVIELFSHRGELVLDPFSGSGTALVAARRLARHAAGFDLNAAYRDLAMSRLAASPAVESTRQLAITGDARSIDHYLEPGSVSLILTSPPYANLLNRRRLNKSRRGDQRRNAQYLQIEQYSQDPRDLGTLEPATYADAIEQIFARLLPLLRPHGHCVIDVPDVWFGDARETLHIAIVERLRRAGFELRNTIIWDRSNIVNRVGIFGWPSNYITMGTTFEYLLDFWRPATPAPHA